MKYKLSKFAILIILLFLFAGFETKTIENEKITKDNQTESFFDIFSPDNLKGINSEKLQKNDLSKINEFTLYAIINTEKVKKVIIKPKKPTKEVKEFKNRRGYVILNLNDKIYDYQLIKIANNIAFFKQGEKILKLSVFNEEKKDRKRIAEKNNGPQVIAPPPLVPPASVKFKTTKKTNSNIRKKSANGSKKTNTKKSKISNITNKNTTTIQKKAANPFLELIKKAKTTKSNKPNNTPTKNPFLQLFKHK
jgi:hypothetical protein